MRCKRESGMQSTDSVAAALAAVVLAATVFKSSLMTVAAVTTPVPPRRAKRAAADEAGRRRGCRLHLPVSCQAAVVSATLVSRALNPKPLVAFQLAADVSVHDGVCHFHSPFAMPPHSSFPSAACSWLSSLSSSCLMSTLGISS